MPSVAHSQLDGPQVSTPDELELVRNVCRESAVVLDPVYSGKALFGFIKVARANPDKFRGTDILFWHTGGGLGMYDKVEQIQSILPGGEVS